MRKNPDLILREIYGKNILMPIRKNKVSDNPIYFNEVAALIWKLSDDMKDVNALLQFVCQIYNLKKDSTEAIVVEDFINQLIENKLILMD